ncbi:MAG: UDP-N-acetylglucosamine 2-epimerase (non-hydrolyzing) [Gammaproteobacteria bacterium]|nr:UDP-N-acetylglucosamine 2-epimerase (non-hydrolyzing) [Gammaproteobacteria bacterium]
MKNSKTIFCIVGARPNFMKIAPIMAALETTEGLHAKLVHTGQHYDVAMNLQFFEQLGIPTPDVDLEVGSGSHAVQTAEVMKRFEPLIDDEKDLAAILVVGDVNSTIACALVAAKKGVPVIHVEAGLRSYDRAMPEEINRVLTDQLSDLLFITERSAIDNLKREGIDSSRVHFTGNVMIDTLMRNLPQATALDKILENVDNKSAVLDSEEGYAVLTLHRPSNVDDPVVLKSLLEAVAEISQKLPVIFPVHPRTLSCIKEFSYGSLINSERIIQLPPLGYLDMLGLMAKARMVLSDSGGIQEETTALGVPCVTLRENTERPITVEEGTNIVVGSDHDKIIKAVNDIFTTGGKTGRIPEYWDGKSALRIAKIIKEFVEL